MLRHVVTNGIDHANRARAARGRTALWIGLLVAGAILFFTVVLPVNLSDAERGLSQSGAWAPVLFSLLMIAGILVAPIPTSPLTLMAPKLFGVWGGLAISLMSATIGAAIAFLVARRLGERLLDRYPEYRKWRELLPADLTAFAVFLLRLPPSPTFDAVSYLAGLTSISLWQFLVATFLGMIPVTAALCFMGALVPAVWLGPLLAGVVAYSGFRIWRKRTQPERRERPPQ